MASVGMQELATNLMKWPRLEGEMQDSQTDEMKWPRLEGEIQRLVR